MPTTKIKDAAPELFEAPTEKTATPVKAAKAESAAAKKDRLKAEAAVKPRQEIAKIEPASPPAPRSMLEVIAQAVMNPACDVAKMEALLNMQERIEANDAKKAFTRAFNALQEELPIINKDGLIDHGDGVTAKGNKKLKTKWATYPNIMRVCGPLLKKHGFTLSNVIEPSADAARIVVVGYLEHIDGHSRVSRFPLGIDATGGKNNNQGWGSSQQYGMRYNAIALLNIVSEAKQDDDNDGFRPKGSKPDDDGFPGDSITSGPVLITEEDRKSVV